MAEEKQSREQDKKTRSLPKNFRQIGEPGTKKIYMEDYVYTYLNKLAEPGNLYARGAILFGNLYRTPMGKCLFISGAAACQNFELDLEEPVFSEESWNEIYQIRDKFFPSQEIVGWFLSRMGFSTELNDKIIRIHMDNFSGENKVLYLIDALENEDAFYQLENYSLKKQKGYYIYYEANQEMKDYMIAEGEMGKIPEPVRQSGTIKRDAAVVKNYRKALNKKKNLSAGKRWRPSYVAGAVFAAALAVYGIYSVRNYSGQETAQTVFAPQQGAGEETSGALDESSETTEVSGTAAESSESGNTGTDGESTSLDAESDGQEGTADSSERASGDADSTDTQPDTQSDAEADDVGTDSTVFTQEEPDDVTESWSQIGGYYTVEEGDTLAGISRKIYQSYDYIEAIAEANDIENIDQIYPGQILEIPQIED